MIPGPVTEFRVCTSGVVARHASCGRQGWGDKQGDAVIPALSSLALRPARCEIQAGLHADDLVVAYVDDAHLVADPSRRGFSERCVGHPLQSWGREEGPPLHVGRNRMRATTLYGGVSCQTRHERHGRISEQS